MGEGLLAVQVRPAELDTSSEAVFVLSTYVIRRDDLTIQRLDFYVSPALARGGAECTRLALRSARTLDAGPRRFDLTARAVTLESGLRDRPIGLTLPEGYVSVTQEGPDFWVHRLHRVGDYADLDTPAGGMIYVGGHPSTMRPEAARPGGKGPVLGEPADWHHWEGGGLVHAESIRTLRDGWYTHVSVYGKSAEATRAIRAAIGTATLE